MTAAPEILEWLARPIDVAAWIGYRDGFKAGHEDELRWKRESYSEQYIQGYRYGVAARQLLKSLPMGRTQKNVLRWAVESFGQIAANRDERAARLAEEAVEVAQAEGVPKDVILRIVERVYQHPPGELWQEIGGTEITLQALAENAGLDRDECAEREWRRVLSKPRSWWKAKHAAKVAAGTADLSAPDC